jgi:ATP-dependent DNA helicase RecG
MEQIGGTVMKENRRYEVKEKVTNTFLKTVSAFANFGGGVIQFGITDTGDVIGVENPKETCLDIENRINDSISPVPVYELSIDDKSRVITLTVEEGSLKPYLYKAKAYKRNDSSTIEVDRLELNRLILEGQNLAFDELTSSQQDLQFHLLEEKMRKILDISSLGTDSLKSIGLMNNKGQYSNAGALLADSNRFPGIDCARFGETIDIILDRKTFDHECVLRQYDEVISLYRQYYQYDQIQGLYRNTIEKIPEAAFRETIANALVHRTWDINAQIRVAMYDDRIEVSSPGGLPSGMTEEEYLKGQVSVLRNPTLAGVFFRLHLIESFGTGIRRINEAYGKSAAKPTHEFSPNAIKVTLPVIQTTYALNDRERVVYDSLGFTGKSSSEIAHQAGFGKNKTLGILSDLEERGFVDKTGNGRGTKYRIRPTEGGGSIIK